MQPQVTAIAKRQERALLDLSVAARRVRAAAGSPPSIRQMAIINLRRAEVRARELGVLQSPEQILEERQAWARSEFEKAWRRFSGLRRLPVLNDQLVEAVKSGVREGFAIAEEWGLDPAELILEYEAVHGDG